MLNRMVYIFARIRMACNLKNILFFIRCHRALAKDKNYSVFNFIRSMILVSKDEKIVKVNKSYLVSSFLPPFPSRAYEQLFTAVPGNDSLFYEHSHAVRTAPISMFIALTNRCKYNCWHCSKAHRENHDDIPLAKIKQLIADLQDMGVAIVGLTGGEPLLRDDLPEIIKSIDDRSISILYTTGQGLTPEKARELKEAGLFTIGISLDSRDEAVHNKLRGSSTAYTDAMNAIRFSLDAGLYTMIQTVATKEMVQTESVRDIIDFAHTLGVHEVRILESMPTGRLIKVEAKHILSNDERKYLIDIHKKANLRRKGPKVSVFAHTESPERFGCGAGSQHSYIDSKGNLNPCDFVPLAFGNVLEKPVRELWKEMNAIIGIPRDVCLIHEIHKSVAKKSNGTLPLNENDSKAVCRSCRTMKEFPGFYSAMQGKKS
ncbi:MAG: radical SAM protein [bacterium]|nr:radical SAM protein [bacterium]